VAFLNWRFGLTQTTLWRIEVAPVPSLSNVAIPTKAIITIPLTLYGCENGDDAEEGGPERCARGWSMSVFLSPKGQTRRLQRRALSRLYSLCSRCIQLQRLAYHAHRGLVEPVQAGLLAQPWRRTRPQGLCQVSTFYTVLVKKSQQANGASELRRTPPTHLGE
jgi:hypothetical protein